MTINYLQETGSVKSDTGTLTDNLGWEAQVLQDGVVDGGQGTAVWTLLLLVLGLTGWLGQDTTLKGEWLEGEQGISRFDHFRDRTQKRPKRGIKVNEVYRSIISSFYREDLK